MPVIPGAIYLWSNGATTRTIEVTSAGITFDVQTFNVEVTNEHGCKTTSTITLNFNFSACTGVEDQREPGSVEIYPNPASDRVNIRMYNVNEHNQVDIMDVYGRVITRVSMPKPDNDQVVRQLDVQELPKGIYLMKFKGRTLNSTHKLVIQR